MPWADALTGWQIPLGSIPSNFTRSYTHRMMATNT